MNKAALALSACAVIIGAATVPLALFGLDQLFNTTTTQIGGGPAHTTDFLSFYSAAQLLVHSPSQLYEPSAVDQLQRMLSQGTEDKHLPFLYTPGAAFVLAPLSLLPYRWAYATWLLVNIVALCGAVLLPAPGRRWLWLVALPLYMPVLLGLVMGQTPPLALLGFAALARLVQRYPRYAGLVLGASPFACKPQLMATILLSLAAARRWASIAWSLLVPAMFAVLVVAIGGIKVIGDYRALWADNVQIVSERGP